MNDQQRMLSDMADGLFATLGAGATLADDWRSVEELALPSLLIGEDEGGFGGSWDDAAILFRLAGFHAVGVPVVEAILAARCGAPLGLSGRGTIASLADGTLKGDIFSGTVAGGVHGDGASYVVAPAASGGSLVIELDGASAEQGTNIADEPRSRWVLAQARAHVIDADIFRLGAFARAAQIAGALDAALEMSVAYANERQQFGRTLAKFQAVQQSLATFACEAAAANCAAIGAAQALVRGDGAFEVSAAKLRANQAVGVGTAIAHQVHGAIGFTHEYALHPLTRRLWGWRSEFGSDNYWAGRLGGQMLRQGADQFWPSITALTD